MRKQVNYNYAPQPSSQQRHPAALIYNSNSNIGAYPENIKLNPGNSDKKPQVKMRGHNTSSSRMAKPPTTMVSNYNSQQQNSNRLAMSG